LARRAADQEVFFLELEYERRTIGEGGAELRQYRRRVRGDAIGWKLRLRGRKGGARVREPKRGSLTEGGTF